MTTPQVSAPPRTQTRPAVLLPARVARLLPLTGLTRAQFDQVVTDLAHALPPTGAGRPWGLPLPQRVLIVCAALRTNLTERALAAVFRTSQSAVDRAVRALTPMLAGLFAPPTTDHRATWVIDGTLIPVYDHTRSALSKNYRRSINTQIVIARRNRLVVHVGTA